jgi:cytochrome d ubiquinol oxidase subunit I
VFAVAFGLGVVSGIVITFEFGTNWSELSRRTGPIRGPLLGYESSTAFALEPSFFGVVIFGRKHAPRWFYLFACVMVAVGTTLSSFWIMVNNSWMQWAVGYSVTGNGVFIPINWNTIIFSPVVWVRFPHMLLAASVTSAFCVAATGTWHLLGGRFKSDTQVMLRMGLGLAAGLVPCQLLFGHITGDYVHDLQPSKFAAIEGRWHDEQPASEVVVAWPDPDHERNLMSINIPFLGSLIGSMSFDSKEVGLSDFPTSRRPPVEIPFFAFRIMAACGLAMLALAWGGVYLITVNRFEQKRWFLWLSFFSFPLGFIATLTGWFTAEVGRHPWSVFGQLLAADAATPFPTTPEVAATLVIFAAVYALIFLFGSIYIYRLQRRGPAALTALEASTSNPKRPLSVPGTSPGVPSPPATYGDATPRPTTLEAGE